ncbi:histidine kinase [Hymenobacter sp. UYP22]|uniref:sensor histidine kinase n=1 Tax=Hymenobacter sp. UYP22 TaxID=3156348 RepID=UPI0033973314
MPRIKIILFHVSLWAIFYLYEVLCLWALSAPVPNPIESVPNYAVSALLLYGHALWIFPRYYNTKRYGQYALGLIGLLAGYCAFRFLLAVYLVPATGITMTLTYQNARVFWSSAIWRGVQFLGYSFTYAYAAYAISMQKQLRLHEQQLRTQEQQLHQQERGLLEADIAFLKSQINPHFLFNALNFLYAQVYPLSEPTAKSVLLLSDIMRYALNEGGEQGKVMLDKEIQHLRNYVALNQLRFGHSLQVQLQVEGSTQFLLILPLVLITFVENCFKHGELFDADHPVLVHLRVQENQLIFFASNRKHSGPVEHSTGIGIENTRRRLAAIYPDRHKLTIHDMPDSYATHLTLAL